MALRGLAQQLDDGQHELGQAALEIVGIGVDSARERVVQARLLAGGSLTRRSSCSESARR